MRFIKVMSDSTPGARRRRLIALPLIGLFICASLVALFVFFQSEDLPPFVLLPANATLNERRPLPDRWMPAKWPFLWRLRYALLGRPETFHLNATVAKSGAAPNHNFEGLFPSDAFHFATNGLRVWMLPEADVRSLRKTLDKDGKVFGSPRISSGEGIVAQMFIGQSVPIAGKQKEVGLTWSCVPNLRKGNTDLTLKALSTSINFEPDGNESRPVLKTNAAFMSRMQIPKHHGVLLVQAEETNLTVFLLSAEWKDPTPAGNRISKR